MDIIDLQTWIDLLDSDKVLIAGDVKLEGHDLKITSETIEVQQDVTVSTRHVGGGPGKK
jgi:hypothetical protein